MGAPVLPDLERQTGDRIAVREFHNKVAVITGGASGVGRSLAFALGRRGAKIAVGDVDRAAMQQVRTDLAAENIESIVEFCDVTAVQSLSDLADKTHAAFGSIDLVFANAGIELWKQDSYAHDTPEAVWDRIHSINLRGL